MFWEIPLFWLQYGSLERVETKVHQMEESLSLMDEFYSVIRAVVERTYAKIAERAKFVM